MQRLLVRRPEGDMVDRTRALPRRCQPRLHQNMQLRRRPALTHFEDVNLALRRRVLARLAHVHNLGHHRLGVGDIGDADDDRSEPADLVLVRHRALRPGMTVAFAVVAHEPKALAFGVFEIQTRVAADLGDLSRHNAFACQMLLPPAKALLAADPEAGPRNAVRAALLASDRPVEEGEIGARCGFAIGIEEVVGRGVVLVHGLLDQPQTQHLRVEVKIVRRIGGDGGEVVDTCQLQAHGRLPGFGEEFSPLISELRPRR